MPREKLAGTIQNDILKEFMVRNTYIYPPEPSMRIVADIIEFTAKHMPKFNSISISGYHMQEAGATTVQELAFTIADGLEYVRAAQLKGLDVDAFAGRLSFFWCIGMNFYLEIAKMRAGRRLWAERMQQEFAPKKAGSLMLRTHCQTSGASLTEQDPLNNVIRTTIEAMAAVFGGTQSAAHEQLRRGGEPPDRQRGARRAQHAADPPGGDRHPGRGRPLGRLVVHGVAHRERLPGGERKLIDEVEALGGMTKAIVAGMPKLRIEEARDAAPGARRLGRGHDRRRQQVPARARGARIEVRDIDNNAVRESQIRAARGDPRRRATRTAVADALAKLTELAQSGEGNLLEAAVEAARARASVGEISEALERVYTRYRAEVRSVSGVYGGAYQGDDEFDAVRRDVAAFAARRGPPAAHARREARPGRPRPRAQGDRHRLRRPRLRRRRRARSSRRPRRRRARRSRTTCT